MEIKKPHVAIEELNGLMGSVRETFYGVVAFNRNSALAEMVKPNMTHKHKEELLNAVNAGVRATLHSVQELDGEIRFKAGGMTAVLSGSLCSSMFDEINS